MNFSSLSGELQALAIAAISLLGTDVVAWVTSAALQSRKQKKYNAAIAAKNAQDSQLVELKQNVNDLINCIGLLTSAVLTQQMGSMALDPSLKIQILNIAKKVETISGIKLDAGVKKAIALMSNINSKAITEERKEEIQEAANAVQGYLDTVNEKANDMISELSIEE